MVEDSMDNGARDALDKDLDEAMQELRSLAQVRLSASSRARVDHRVEAAIGRLERERKERKEPTMNQAALVTSVPPRLVPNERTSAPRRAQRHPSALTWFATAALLVVTLGLSFATFGLNNLRSTPPTAFPAAFVQGATPVGPSDTHFAVTFPAPVLPAGPVYAWSTLYAVESGVSAAYPGFEIEDPVAAVVWVQSGMMAIDGEHVAVHRASTGAPSAAPAAGELLLGAGDAVGLELGPGRSYHLRSVGPEPLVFAEFWLVGGLRPNYTYPPEYESLDYFNINNATTLSSPATVTIRLTQTVLAPKETLEPEEEGWQLALIERGTEVGFAREAFRGTLKNIGQAPGNVVVMTAEFQEVAATPPAATPSG